MDLAQAIKERHSIRAFKPDPVPLDVIRKIMEPALRAPSWANTQPWEFAVATGKVLKEIQDGFLARGVGEMQNEIPRPFEFPEPYMERIRGLQPKDRKEMTPEEMKERMLINFKHYGASTCIYLLLGRNIYFQSGGINSWSLYDSGSCVQNIMLLATAAGLGTIAQAQAAVYPDIIRKALNIPEDKAIALGIAIGYEDTSVPPLHERTARDPLDKIATFHGF
ncbi:MAG: nitroreductase [Dehalococcoidales bacterium]|nr:nitroreductase [Dehalococcoidales bacterium]